MKKFFLSLAVLAALFLIFEACGSSGDDGKNDKI